MTRPLKRWPLLSLFVAAAVLLGVTGSASAAGHRSPKPTVVLVHGAFADASGFAEVIRKLRDKGYPVLAPANPLRGVESDAAYVRSVLAQVPGPVVLAGHSYGGFVMTNAATGNPNVKALVYLAAFAPDAGDTVGGLSTMFPGSSLGEAALDVRAHPGGLEGYLKPALFREVFAADVSAATATVMGASQRPADLATLQQPSGVPAWKTIPSWTLVARDDRVIPAAAQRFMAQRAHSHVTEVNASHVVMVSRPGPTTDIILAAVKGVS